MAGAAMSKLHACLSSSIAVLRTTRGPVMKALS